jgi:hypothetical protein
VLNLFKYENLYEFLQSFKGFAAGLFIGEPYDLLRLKLLFATLRIYHPSK